MPAKTRQKTKRRNPIDSNLMVPIEPLTDNQKRIFEDWDKGKHLFIYGAAGTGKTFCALYKALYDCLKATPSYDNVYVVRSLVATREIGFLPGDHEDKSSLYQIPYKNMVKYMFEMGNDQEFDALYGSPKHKRPSSSGRHHSYVVSHWTMLSSSLMKCRT